MAVCPIRSNWKRKCFYSIFNSKKLIAIKGIVNWKKYVIYAKDIAIMYGNEKHNANLYLTYLDMIDKVDIKLPWKIAKGEMQKMLERARLGSYDNFDKNHEKEMDVLKQKAAEWQKYCYEDGKFLIIFPQKPSDFIKEGDYLHHCAKTYLDPVIKGWTVLVFLRKSSQPDKPFYTVEISGNKIRQVHGMENKDPDKEVEEFLKDYCVEKNILFYNKNAVLGPKNPNPLLPYRN